MFTAATPAASLVFALTIGVSLYGLYSNAKVIESNLFRPYWFLRKQQYLTLFSSGFIHADIGHLLFNMFTFYFFAFTLESRFLGTTLFVGLYAIALAASHACTYFLHKDDQGYASLGASGAISAVLFAYIIYSPMSKLIIMPIPVPIPAVLFAVGYVAYSYYAGRQQRGRINHDAHLCGALAGVVYIGVVDPGAFRQLLQMIAN